MGQKLYEVFDGRCPYDWLLDAAEVLLLGLDCVVVAGTGAGKMIPFALSFKLCVDDIYIFLPFGARVI